VKKLFPWVSEVSIKGGKGWGWKEIQLHEASGVTFNSNQLSDGVLRLLAVICLLYLDSIPPVLSLEEPENGVHPQLLREVVQLLRELTLRKPPDSCQVFFTTHSPYVLDEFYDNPEQVYLMERGKGMAGARIARLSDCSEVDLVRELFSKSLGEAWFSGVIGGYRGKA
jgi:predicted ATPase